MEITLRIGKDGISEPFLSELVDQLKRRDLVKLKANKSISSDRKNRQQMFSEISERVGSTMVFQRGMLQCSGGLVSSSLHMHLIEGVTDEDCRVPFAQLRC